jgi:hypothetical protein
VDIGREGNGGSGGGVLRKHQCPVCSHKHFTPGVPHYLGTPVDPNETRRIAVVPLICKSCKAITLVLSPDQPGTQPSA